jgi:hypothetical protein
MAAGNLELNQAKTRLCNAATELLITLKALVESAQRLLDVEEQRQAKEKS